MTISGLTPGETYSIYSYFWSTTTDNWRLKSSLSQTPPLANDTTVSFSRTGTATSADAPAVATGIDGADNLGVTYTGTGSVGGGNANWTSDSYFTTNILIGEGNRTLYQADLGSAIADGSGNVVIYIDDLENTGTANRTWFDGAGYERVPEPTSSALLGLALGTMLLRRRRN